MENKRIGIIGAMDAEVSSLIEETEIEKVVRLADMEFCLGRLHDKEVAIVKCGMGKVNAGICASTLIREFGCAAIINTGVAGSLDERMDIGDIVLSVDAVEHDFDVSVIGFQKGEIPYTGKYAFPADERLRKLAVAAVKQAAPEVHAFEGRICSGDQFIASKEQKDAIVRNFGGLCCEMEGAAVAQTCHLFSIPYVIIRAISDKPDGSGAVDFARFAPVAAKRCAKIVDALIQSL